MIKPTRSPKLVTVLLLACALAACSRDEPERAPENDVQQIEDLPPTPTPTPSPTRVALPAPDATVQSNAMDELTEAPPEPDEQMLDDAAASGMTSRASRSDPAPQQTPAEVVEQK
ncbi:hypothetical protein [Sphingomonas sp. Leaf357]|uniref:hypothetical protein n=1 Tax=Sphingomonas sp. Leaf357 TaxID=1736350 RepID=UPI0009E92CA2|nr:hypothetical protein [Sphingomonas sp. Leaf357]